MHAAQAQWHCRLRLSVLYMPLGMPRQMQCQCVQEGMSEHRAYRRRIGGRHEASRQELRQGASGCRSVGTGGRGVEALRKKLGGKEIERQDN